MRNSYKALRIVFFMFRKKGDVTIAQIVGLVMAIVGFVVVIILLTSLDFQTYSDEEVCRLSVLSRATSEEVKEGASNLIPLKCTTKKICITSKSKKECSQFIGEKDVVEVDVSLRNSEEARKIIEKTATESMYSCWKMMGEGKIDLFAEKMSVFDPVLDVKLKGGPSCVICSRIALGNDLLEGEAYENIVKKVDINEYMKDNGPPGSTFSYLNLLTDSKVDSYTTVDGNLFKNGSETARNKGYNTPTNETANQLSVIFMQVKANEQSWAKAAGDQAALTSGVLVGGALLIPLGKVIATPFGIVTAIATIGGTAGYAALAQYNNQLIAAYHCGDLTGNSNLKGGCSVVRFMDYDDIKDINKMCAVIEGNP